MIIKYLYMHALILCNGQPPPQALFEEKCARADLFIGADGGGNVARSLGAQPDVVIGDLDSFVPQDEDSFEVIRDPDQYANDLEKALSLAWEKGVDHIHILGATGRRLDHTLKNLSALKQFDERFKSLSFEDEYLTGFLLPKTFSRKIAVDTAVSLFPLSGRVDGITTTGLKFNLRDDFLENGLRDGSSNTVILNPVSIVHTKGDLLLFIVKS